MTAHYDVLIIGNNLRLRDDFLGISTVCLIEAPGFRALLDTGGPSSRFALINALAGRGIGREEIDLILLSHLHYDHCYNLDLFPKARIVVAQAELDYAAEPHPDDLVTPDWILERLSRRRVEALTADTALAKGVEMFHAPGHTRGHHAVRLETAVGPVVLACDAIKYPKEVMTRRCDLAFDTVQRGSETIGRILDMAERIVPGHFPELHREGEGWAWDGAAEFPLLIR